MNNTKQNKKAYDANYYQRNREKRLKQIAAWKLANPGKVRESNRKYRAKMCESTIFFQMIQAAADLAQYSRMAHPSDTAKT